MTYRLRLLVGLLTAVPLAVPTTLLAANGNSMQWMAGGAPGSSYSSDDAAQLARQAAELAARAAQMASSPQNAPQASAAQNSTPSLPTGPQAAAGTNGWKNSAQDQQGPTEILFQKPSSAAGGVSGSQEAAGFPQGPRNDQQIQLVARNFTDATLIRAAQEEPLPAVSDAVTTPPAPLTPDLTNGTTATGEMCYPPQRLLYWVSGVEATFLSPDLNNRGASFEIEDVGESRDDWFSTFSDDVDSLYVAPRAWIGVQGCCWGGVFRYWHMQAGEGRFDPTISEAADWGAGWPDAGYFTSSRFEAYTIDLELTRRFCIHDHWMQASFGLRHAEIWHSESITGLADTTDGIFEGFAHADRNTRGTGIVMGLYGRKPVFPCSCVHWFYNFRFSALWGPTETNAETYASVLVIDPMASATAGSVNGALTRVDDNLFIGEIQFGLEWNYALQCLPANSFCHLALEYQRWGGGMGTSEAGSFAGVDVGGSFTTLATTATAAEAPELDLFGFTLGAGLTW